jgi:predicted permease
MHDMAFAWRNALKRPATSLLIIITLALGIGANTAMFSVAYKVLLAPLPYADGERLVRLEQNGLDYFPNDAPWSDATLADYRAQSTVFSHLVEYTQNIYTVVGQGDPWQGNIGLVGWDYFDMLGVSPLLGRAFAPADSAEDAEAVMLLSYDTWRSRFGADPAVIGRTLEMSRILYRVIGVLHAMPAYPQVNDAWVPAAHDPFRVHGVTDAASNRASGYVQHVFGKLNAGVSIGVAVVEMDAIAARLAQAWPDVYTEHYSLTLKSLQDEMTANSATIFVLLFGLALLVMLIASANVANLNLAALAARSQELAVREAVGASPSRIRRLVLTESLLFALVGGVLGLGIVQICLGLLVNYVASYTPLANTISLDATVLLYSFAAALFTGVLSGSLAFYKGRDINAALKEGGDKITATTAGTKRRQLLLLTQFALAFVVLNSAALIVLSLYRLSNQPAGYDTDDVLELSMLMNLDLAAPGQERQAYLKNFGEQLRARAEALPGVQASGILGGAPLLQDVAWLRPTSFEVDDPTDSAPGQPLSTRINFVSARWFEVMGIPLLRGRLFEEADAGASPVAIVNASLAERYFPGESAIGKTIRYAGTSFELPIVGVVENFRSRSLSAEDAPAVYFFRDSPTDALNFYVRSSGSLVELAEALTGIVHELNPRQSVVRAQSLDEIQNDWLSPTRLRTVLVCLFGVLALVVTLSGVVGVVSYNVGQRVREIGVHMAVGADPLKVTRMFVFQSMKVYAGGLLLGLALTLFVAPFVAPLLYQTSVFNPGVYAAVILLLTCVVLLAIYLPARRAGLLNPMEALHAE